jgi:signal transduction histidine kinase
VTAPAQRKKLLVVSSKREAGSLLADLRAAGHNVSLVDDLEQAAALLESGSFHQVVISGREMSSLLGDLREAAAGSHGEWCRSVAALAYDLRYLLGALEHGIMELARQERGSARLSRHISEVRHTISVLSGFLRELTEEMSSGGTGEIALSDADIEDLIETAAMAVYPSAAERSQRLAIDVDEGLATVRVDAVKLKRALSNLLHHASSRSPPYSTVTVRVHAENDDCLISVSYTGDTLTLAELRRLFSPAWRGRNDAGADLVRAQWLVEQQGGRLWVESEKAQGTSIFICLPSAVKPSSRVASRSN